MANFNEIQIQTMIKQLRDEYGPDIATRELAVLELEDMKRKGCVLDFSNRFDECRSCPKADECPVLTWEKRHPEYANDELAMKIKVLEAGGEEAYKEKLKRQEEAKREAERATDTDKIEAICFIRRTYFEHGSEIGVDPLAMLNNIDEIIKSKTKSEIKAIVAKQI